MYKYCDLGHIVEPSHRPSILAEDNHELNVDAAKTLFSFDVVVKSNTLSHLIGPGTYKLTLVAAGANTNPIKKTLEITFNGEWFSNETTMLQQGIGIKLFN